MAKPGLSQFILSNRIIETFQNRSLHVWII